MVVNFKDFLANIIVESLHPELQDIVKTTATNRSKQSLLAAKIKDLTNRGEATGIEGNMPKGSSRAYMQHQEPHPIVLDGHQANIRIGTKVAIKASLDRYHSPRHHDGLGLGAMQNRAEGGDHFINRSFRILTEDSDNKGHFSTNHENGIFPPLIDHDHDSHEHSTVGHCRSVKGGEFAELTKHPDFPKGITHQNFCDALNRYHEQNNGKYWAKSPAIEQKLDKITSHPLVQKFTNYLSTSGNPPYDYQQKQNMGIFEHPDGSRHIVARDSGFSSEVEHAYTKARIKQYGR